MASNSETGHAKNIANQNGLNQTNSGFADYAPTNPLIPLAAMQAQNTACNNLQEEVNIQNGIFLPKRNARIAEFKSLKAVVRRVRSFAKTCGAGAGFYSNVNKIATKILGERSSSPTPSATDPSGTSASQQSYDNTVNNFDALIEVLKNEAKYTPNINALKVVTLEAKLVAMTAANHGVATGVVPYNTAVINRNKGLYTTEMGLVDVCQTSKDYVRGVYGYSSPEYKLVTTTVRLLSR